MQNFFKNSVNFAENIVYMNLKWIFFDLDDTLFDFSAASLSSLKKLWEEETIINTLFSCPDDFISEYHIHNSRMWQLHEKGEITSEFLKPERFRLTLSPTHNDEETLNQMRRLNSRYLKLLGMCNKTCHGASELLEFLNGKYLIGILTNGFTEVQYNKLRSTGLDRYIQRMVISDEIGVQKPDSRLFDYACNAVGAAPGEILMVGDNPDNDVAGALNSGWNAVFYDKKGRDFSSDSPLYRGKITGLICLKEILGKF